MFTLPLIDCRSGLRLIGHIDGISSLICSQALLQTSVWRRADDDLDLSMLGGLHYLVGCFVIVVIFCIPII
jgi:hypothetical protein